MIFGSVSRLESQAIWLLILGGGLLILAGRADASLGERSGPVLARRPPLLAPLGPEARLAISGQMLVLELRGGDLAGLADRIDAAEDRQIAIRVDGEEILVAELREIRLEGDPLEEYSWLPRPEPILLGPHPVLAVALATPPGADAGAEEAEDEAAAADAEAETPSALAPAEAASLPVPEPGSAALLALGLLGLGLAGRRAAP